MKYSALAACAVSLLAFTGGLMADGVTSGPQVGKNLPGAFHPTNVTGSAAGKKHCLV